MDPSSPYLPTAPKSPAKVIIVAVLLLTLNTFLTLLIGVCSEPGAGLFVRFFESLHCWLVLDPRAIGLIFGAPLLGTIVVAVSLIFKRARNEIVMLKVFSAAMIFLILGNLAQVMQAGVGH